MVVPFLGRNKVDTLDSPEHIFAEVFAWLRGVVQRDEIIQVVYKGTEYLYQYAFPIFPGDVPKRITTGAERAAFYLREPARGMLDDSWVQIFVSPRFELFEYAHRVGAYAPLRLGFSDQEQRLLMQAARQSLAAFLRNEPAPSVDMSPSRLFVQCTVGVALWCNGALRGSQVVENRALITGVVVAARNAAVDARFVPLAPHELLETRIEITVLVGPRFTYVRGNDTDAINPIYGYQMQHKNRIGWLFPEIGNRLSLPTQKGFFQLLASQKTGIAQDEEKDAHITTFPICDIIESADWSRVIRLRGPIPALSPQFRTAKLDRAELLLLGESAAAWLLGMQRVDGSMPLYRDPFTGMEGGVDLVRLALTVQALVEYGRVVAAPHIIASAEKSYRYLVSLVQSQQGVGQEDVSVLVSLYLGHAAYALAKDVDVVKHAARVAVAISDMLFDPIVHAQALSLCALLPTQHDMRRSIGAQLCCQVQEQVRAMLHKKNSQTSLALWIECAHALLRAGETRSAEEVASWCAQLQCADGSFPNYTHDTFETAYTRGTAKIVEVLSCWPIRFEQEIAKAMQWLSTMQYTDDSLFFVPTELRDGLRGGFRHDYFRPAAWIDTNAHLLLGITRLLQ